MKSILDPSFRYTKSVDTDLRETFARVRRDLCKPQEEPSTVRIEEGRKVLPFRSRQTASQKTCVRGGQVTAAAGSMRTDL